MKRVFVIISLMLFVSCKESKTLIFEENFDGTELNENIWNYELGNGCPNICGWGNNERQFYTKKNARVKDGLLIITATKTDSLYESARITTANKVEFQYGTVEVRAQLPKGHGLWPAIWMLGNDIKDKGWPSCGEIDIMEYVGKEPHTIYTSMHTPESHGNTINSKKTIIDTIEEGFHTYTANWTKDSITFYIDNKRVYTYSPEIKNNQNWPYNKPFYIILNMAIGGNFGGPKVDDSIFPQEFIVDYIKVYQE